MSGAVPHGPAPAPAGVGPVDVVIVSYNSAAHLAGCLAGLVDDAAVGAIVVVDNGSTDDGAAVVASIVADHPSVRWLPTGVNLGFGRAANRGIAATTAATVLVLNPDTVVAAGAVGALAAALVADARLGVAGPLVRNPDGTRYPSARAFPSLADAVGHAFVGLVRPDNRWTRRYRDPARVDWVSGTAMALRRDAVEQVGGFDEDYFMYVEDVDLCWRLRRAGWGVALVPAAEVVHSIGASSESAPYRMIAAHHRSLLRFEARTATGARRLLLPVVAVGLAVRTAAAVAQRAVRRRPHAAP